MKLNFLRLFDKFLALNRCFGLFTKIKKGSGIAFNAHFQYDFSIKLFLFDTLSMDKVSM